jgi:hypothetical protein
MDPLILEILVGVLILSSFGLAYMVSKTWRVTHVLLLNLVFLTGIVYWYMAARTLKIHSEWRGQYNKQTAMLKDLQQQNVKLVEGSEDDETLKRSLRQLQYELADLVSARGQVWRDIEKVTADPQSGQVTIDMTNKDHGLAEKTIVFLFESAPAAEGGDYLGEYQVSAVQGEKTVVLTPHLPLTPEQLARLAETKAPLSVYSTMPTDDPKLLAGLDPQRQQAIIPDQAAREEFASADRPVRDYNALFHSFHAQRQILGDEKAKALSDIKRLQDANKRVVADAQYRTGEISRLTEDLSGFQREAQIVTAYFQQLVAEAKKTASVLKTSKAHCAQLAAAVTALQLENARAVNAQTGTEPAAE